MTSSEELQELDGWELSSDKKVLKKIYEVNTQENIVVKDIAGNEQTVLINISQINNNNDNNNGEENNNPNQDDNKKNDIFEGNIIDSQSNQININDNNDNTIKNKVLPQTGENIFIIITIVTIIICMTIIFIKYRNLRDVK